MNKFSQKQMAACRLQRKACYSKVCFLWLGLTMVIHSADYIQQTEYTARSFPANDTSSEFNSGFTRIPPQAVGISWRNHLSSSAAEQNRILENGSGVAAGDVNGDGHCDLYFATIQGANHLHLNNGDWTFQELDLVGGADCAGQSSTGALFADVEGDGDLDLLVNGIGTGTRLFINDGSANFVEHGESGLARTGGGMSMAMADADQDGDLDLYVAHYRENTWKDLPSGVTPRVVQRGNRPHALPEDRFLAIDHGPGRKPGITEVGEPDRFYINNGDGTFQHQTWTGGRFRDDKGQILDKTPRYWGLSVLFRDLNGDTLPDLLVCNDFAHGADQIWMNQGEGVFQQLSNLAMRQSSWSSMAADVADINRDGHDDFFIVEMLSRKHSRRQTQRANYETGIEEPSIAMGLDRPQTQRNTLFLNRGDGSYSEIARMAGLDATEWSWGTVFMDVDLDGWDDVLVANGNNHDLLDGDATIAAMVAMRSAPKNRIPKTLLMYPALETSNLVFRNKGDLTFEDMSKSWGFDEIGISQGICLADLDRDGDLDVVLNNLQRSPSIYRNNATGQRISVRLRGGAANPQAIGARLRLVATHSVRPIIQTRVVSSGGRYLSSDENLVVFATPEGTVGMRLEIDWPGGQCSQIENIQPNKAYTLLEPKVKGSLKPRMPKLAKGLPLFEEASVSLFSKKHMESPMQGAMTLQPLLPRYLDRWGPSFVVGDLNGDGLDDLAMGQGQAHPATVTMGAQSLKLEGSAVGDQTDLIFWRGNNRKMRLAISISNMTTAFQNGLKATRSQPSVLIYQKEGERFDLVQALPGQRALPGCLELIDHDKDGDLDLFVGGRMNPGRYPEPSISRLYENDRGHYKLHLEQSRLWFDMGLVTDAKSLDWDGDGDQDLIVACEWGNLRLWENINGTFSEKTEVVGLASRKGLWTALEVADLDGDGDLDVLAGNWGRNTDYQRHNHHSIRMYHGDLDNNGSYDLVESYYEPESEEWVPLRDLIALGNAFPFVRERHRTYVGMSKTHVDELFQGISTLDAWLEVNTLETGVFWNDQGRFQWQPLPFEAQQTSVISLAVSDFNGDGHADIFMGQNFQSLQPEMSRFDAGLGLILLGNGGMAFKALTAEESGIRMFGEQSEVVTTDWNDDGLSDLLIGQTAGDLRLFLQSSNSPLSVGQAE